MDWLIIALIIFGVFSIAIIKLSQKSDVNQSQYPYVKQDVLFSPAERSFFGVLKKAAGNGAQVFGKVRVADVIAPTKGMSRSDWQKAFNKISGKHFDYIICDANDLSILCAIELNDSSHSSKKRKDRDEFLQGACLSAGVPLIQITAKATYSINEVRLTFDEYMPKGQRDTSVLEDNHSQTAQEQHPVDKLCPKCSSKMIKRTAKKGKNIGKKFWACSSFPNCKHIEAIIA